MAELRSPGSRVVLVGTQSCANDVAAPPVPAVESTMDDLAGVLAKRCGVRSEQIIRILDSADPMRMGLAVAEAADQATDVLLVHYVGHGFVSADGELYLATKATDPESYRLEHSSVAYSSIRRSLLNSRARAIVVVLDCCFSGRAIGTLSSQDPIDLADVHGGYVLTSAARDQVALAPPGARHTAFTGELIRLLDRGDPTGPALLSMRDVFRSLDRELHRRGLPRPRQRGSERIDDLVLAANAAHSATTVPPRTAPLPPAPPKRSASRKRGALGKRGALRWPAVPGRRLLVALLATGAALAVAVQFGSSDPVSPTPPPSGCASRSAPADCDAPAPSTALDSQGRFVTLHQDAAGVVRYQQRPDGSLAQPEELGDAVAHGAVILPDSNEKLIAFGVDESGKLEYNLAIGGDVRAAKGNWRQLAHVGDARGRPAAAKDGTGKITVFFRDAGDELWSISQLEAGEDKWGGAVLMGDKNSAAPIFGDPEVHIDRNGTLRVFALDKETRTLRAWAQKPGQSFKENPQNPFRDRPLKAAPTVALQGDGRMHLFALDESGALWQTIEGAPNSWPASSNPVPGLEGVHTGSPVAATNADGGVTVFAQLAEKPGRVVYASGGGPVPGTLERPMDVLWSVTPDESGRLTVHGEKDGAMVADVL